MRNDRDASWDGDSYHARFEALAAQGEDVHGEAHFVLGYRPRTVLDAGCGTGRVAIELARRGVDVVGVDRDPSMLSTARRHAPHLEWIEGDLTRLDLGRDFDVVVLAGNVPLFTPKGTERALVVECAAHVAPGGVLIAGFQRQRGYALEHHDEHAVAAGLQFEDRFSTWDREPFDPTGDYVVSVHRRPSPDHDQTP